jgi:3-oxoadipate enol-lactonase
MELNMNTVTIHGIEIAFTRHGTGKSPLVLVHGYPLDHSIWLEVSGLLATEFDVILPDLRGFGQSGLEETEFTMADMATDIAGLLDQLEIQKAIIAGHSMGGYVSLAFAYAYPERVMGLGLVASQAGADTPERKQSRHKAAGEILSSGVGAVAGDMPPMLTAIQEGQVVLQELISKQRPAGLAGALKAMAERKDMTAELPNFRFPVVLIHGDADELIPIERAREVKKVIPDAELLELSGVGHMPMMEAPQAVYDALNHLK